MSNLHMSNLHTSNPHMLKPRTTRTDHAAKTNLASASPHPRHHRQNKFPAPKIRNPRPNSARNFQHINAHPPRVPPHMPDRPLYTEKETVHCYHGLHTYEAKVVKINNTGDKPLYFIHYKGWNTKWDEWVDASRLVKYSEGSVRAVGADIAKKDAGDEREETRAEKAQAVRAERECMQRRVRALEDDLRLRNVLYEVLVDDWRNVTKSGLLLHVPARPSVHDAMQAFVTDFRDSALYGGEVEEFRDGVLGYFVCCLPVYLLYHKERMQYSHVVQDSDVDVCKVYPPVHLLRLLVRLPCIVAHAKLDEFGYRNVAVYVQRLLAFLAKRCGEYFGQEGYFYEAVEMYDPNKISMI